MYVIILLDTLVAENYFIEITREINGKYFDFYSAIFHSLLHNVYRTMILFVLSSVYFITVQIISSKLMRTSSKHENNRHSSSRYLIYDTYNDWKVSLFLRYELHVI